MDDALKHELLHLREENAKLKVAVVSVFEHLFTPNFFHHGNHVHHQDFLIYCNQIQTDN
jgi:hypothetical protein